MKLNKSIHLFSNVSFRKHVLLILFSLSLSNIFTQEDILTDMFQKFHQYQWKCNLPCTADSEYVLICDNISWQMKSFNADSALIFANEGLNVAQKIKWNKGMGRMYTQKAICLKYLARFDEALKVLSLSEKHWKLFAKENSKNQLASTIGIIKVYYQYAAIYANQGNINESNKVYYDALKLAQSINDEKLIGGIYGNLGVNFNTIGDYGKAMEYTFKSIRIFDKIKNEKSSISCLHTMGYTYLNQKQPERSLVFFKEALIRALKINDLQAAGDIYHSISDAFDISRILDSVLPYKRKAIKTYLKTNNIYSLAIAYLGISDYYYQVSQFDSSLFYARKTINIATSVGANNEVESSQLYLAMAYHKLNKKAQAKSEFLNIDKMAIGKQDKAWQSKYHLFSYLYHKETGNAREAFNHLRFHKFYEDSIYSEVNERNILRSELNYAYEKKSAADSVKSAEAKNLINAQLKQEKIQRLILFGGIALMLVFAIFMINRFVIARKQKKLIEIQRNLVEAQKATVEEKQNEILDSIHYAKRIQTALITSEFYFSKNLIRLLSK